MTQLTRIPAGTFFLSCSHLDADNVRTYTLMVGEQTYPVAACETCTDELIATGDISAILRVQLLHPDQQVHRSQTLH